MKYGGVEGNGDICLRCGMWLEAMGRRDKYFFFLSVRNFLTRL